MNPETSPPKNGKPPTVPSPGATKVAAATVADETLDPVNDVVANAGRANSANSASRAKTAAAGDGAAAAPTAGEVTPGIGDAEIRIEYLSAMSEGRSLFPEDLLGGVLADPMELPVPLRLLRLEMHVQRDGELVSPISARAISRGPTKKSS